MPITRLALALALVMGAACRQEGPAVAIDATEPAVAASKPAATSPAPSRALWFADGPGRDAILARERGDHPTACAQLEALLATPDQTVSADDRAAAQLLLGLEDVLRDRHASAAERFARARASAALSAIAPRIRLLEAQARLDAGEPAPALALVRELDPKALAGSPLVADMLVVEADASLRTDDIAKARTLYRKYLAEHPRGERRLEVTAKLARSLATSTEAADLQAAAAAFESLLVAAPLSELADDAQRELAKLRAAGHGKKGAALRELERKLAHARIDAMIDRGRYKQALKAADALLGGPGVGPMDRCQANFAKGTAVFKQRDRAKSRTHFEHAVTHCTSAGAAGVDLLVKATYQAGRGRYAEGKYGDAAKSFEKLAKDHAAHSYADDAWVLAGESWDEGGDHERALTAWKQALAVAGDMAEEARRRLLVAAFARGDDAEALRLVDDGLRSKSLSPAERGKLSYFRGRALARTGDADGAKAAWLETLAAGPLDYPALQALSRLRELGDDAWNVGVATLVGAAPSSAATKPVRASESALVLARLGLGEWAKDELRATDVDGWPAVIVLNQAGLYGGAQRLVGGMGTSWRTTSPKDDRERWTAVHPQPFLELIGTGETTAGVPQWLTYAIMQTESRFEPGATSFAGARGLVQLMPSTAKQVATQVGIDLKDDDVLFDPATNLALGMHHLGSLVARFGGGDGAVALAIPSYNAGAGSVERWLDERGTLDLDVFIESIPYDETRKYTQSVLGRWLAYRVLYGTAEDLHDRLPYLALPIRRGP